MILWVSEFLVSVYQLIKVRNQIVNIFTFSDSTSCLKPELQEPTILKHLITDLEAQSKKGLAKLPLFAV